MKCTLESTEMIINLPVNGAKVPVRLWKGTTESGVPMIALIHRVSAKSEEDTSRFEAELQAVSDQSSDSVEFARDLIRRFI